MPLFSNLVHVAKLDVAGRRVFLRVDFDVPCSPHGAVLDDTRLREGLATLRMLVGRRAKVLVASHYGPPEAPDGAAASGVALRLAELLGMPVATAPKEVGPFAATMEPGDVAVLPNLWLYEGEADNDPDLAMRFARSIDVYVNDALRSSNAARVSTVGLPRLVASRGMGVALGAELDAAGLYLEFPQRPVVGVFGGSRLLAKAPLLRSLFGTVDALLFGGSLATTFLAASGIAVGRSQVERHALDAAKEILELARSWAVPIGLPSDVLVRDGATRAPLLVRKAVTSLGPDDVIVDVALDTCLAYREVLVGARMTIWNGVMGLCDSEDTSSGTFRTAQAMTEATPYVLAVGDRTLAQIAYFKLTSHFRYLARGGDVTLELLRGTVFPGVEALRT